MTLWRRLSLIFFGDFMMDALFMSPQDRITHGIHYPGYDRLSTRWGCSRRVKLRAWYLRSQGYGRDFHVPPARDHSFELRYPCTVWQMDEPTSLHKMQEYTVVDAGSRIILRVNWFLGMPEKQENAARRIAACLNACQNLKTEELEERILS